MIPRRARIKGIANIPLRRKQEASTPSTPANNIKVEQNSTPSSENISDVNCKIEKDNNVDPIKSNIKIENVSVQTNQQSETVPTIENDLSSNQLQNDTENSSKNDIKEKEDNETKISVKEAVPCVNEAIPPINEAKSSINETKPLVRRWVPKPKPSISIGALNRRPKPNLITQKENTLQPILNQNIENENPTKIDQHENSTSEIENNHKSPDTAQNNSPPNLPSESSMYNSISDLNNTRLRSNSESEKNPPTPLSPNKIINRTRIRPTPKLIRRNSIQGSASESEDETRKTYKRIRNDSVCSTASYSTENINTSDGQNTKQKNISSKVHKLFRRSEQSRKLAEARKEFYTKFGSKIPDRKRLTMMDLIYYNPITNPMPQLNPTTTIIKENTENPPTEEQSPQIIEENVDEPIPDDPPIEEENDEEADCTPVPQVKVGPNGEIILDEQSLVIEQTGTKRGREQLANSQVINGDDLNRTYGIYKRPKRAKEWSAMETLRFYRSLNTVGTDFSLMVTLFPGRTRRELKVKFKKEEKINRSLIDKALTNPIDFDLSDLEKQAKDEEELEARKKSESENKKDKKPRRKGPYIRKPGSSFSKTMHEENQKSQTPKVRPKRKIKKDRYSVLENGLDDIIDSNTDSEEEYIPKKVLKTNFTHRTRRLRKDESDLPNKLKVKKDKFGSDSDSNHNMENEIIENVETVTPNIDLGINLTINEETQEVNIYDENQYEEPESNNDDNVTEIINNNDNITKIINNDDNATEMINNDDNVTEMINNDDNVTEMINDDNVTEMISNDDNGTKMINNDDNVTKMINNDDPSKDLSSVEPGSLMIMQSEDENGAQTYKVFMITPDQQKVEVDLSPDVIHALALNLGSDEVVNLDLPVINEVNDADGKSEIIT